ncbi:hypothetical protein [Lentilactobacillus hilgardii]|uniref:hypothetical protein n=1 Tax=Lentilactobacillus hilgardii TaxID=1588 RepID=UPI000305420B|nr:hypothetical protein [Lentilactobacillus hilgardii]
MSNILLSSRAFKTTAITDAFHNLLIHSANNAPSITVIVNSVKEGKMHPKIIELQQRLKQLGFNDVTLLDVLHDDLSAIGATKIRIYPHFDQHIQLDPQLATKLRHWEIVKNQTITRLTNQEALLIENDRVIKL